jgi:hypothetical protein
MAVAGQKSVGFLPAGTRMGRGFGPGMSHEMATGVLAFEKPGYWEGKFWACWETQEVRARGRMMSAVLNMGLSPAIKKTPRGPNTKPDLFRQ